MMFQVQCSYRRSAMEEIQEARKRCVRVIDRIQRLSEHTRLTTSCARTLLKLSHSELQFLSRFSSVPQLPLSSNIGHLEAVICFLEQTFVTGVSRVCKPIPLPQAIRVHVDIVCILNKSPVWIIVSDRNPKYLSWDNCLKLRVESVLAAARSSQVLKPSSIILFFSRGLQDSLVENLRDEFGAFQVELEFDLCVELENEWINVVEKPYSESVLLEIKVECTNNAVLNWDYASRKESFIDSFELELKNEHEEVNSDDAFSSFVSKLNSVPVTVESDCHLINFDTTALVALVSGISNGCANKLLAAPEIELRKRFKGNFDFVIAQVLSEIENPMHKELSGAIAGKRGIVCESVVAEFKELASLCGGPNENLRADKILKHLMIVPDNPSERMMCIPTTRKLAMKSKVAFGTGDRWRAPTLTANMAFVRAVSQTGMSLFTIEHRPRALTGD
ncbi:uncharacterized protein [Euphorbia lathyris]|uniref:uncharacterized protein n=1 Tax=Euphorbia lathyris TaxID=212925 RepID=UPI0033144C62